MGTESEERDGFDDWLDELGGKGGGKDKIAGQLREVVQRQQQRNEADIDELRLRRGRDRLLAEAEKFGSASKTISTPPFLAIAASVAIVFTAGLFGYQTMFSGSGSDYELILSYGDLERPRGSINTLTVDVDVPESVGRLAAERLTLAQLPFELRTGDEDSVRLAVTARDEISINALIAAVDGLDMLPDGPGYYVIVLE